MIRRLSSLLVLCALLVGSFAQTPAPLVCPFDENDDNLQVLYPPLLDEDFTEVTFDGQSATFEAMIRVPKQYETAVFSFEGAADPAGGYDSENPGTNLYWSVDYHADACNVVYRANIPWDLFRTTLGGVERRDFAREVSYFAQIEIETTKMITVTPETLLELQEESGKELLQGVEYPRKVSTIIPFEVTFETHINLENSIRIPSDRLRLSAALLETSVLSVELEPFDARARLEFLTTIPLPLSLTDASITVDNDDLRTGLVVRELESKRDCDQDEGICTQFWEVDVYPHGCNLNGIFIATMTAACFDTRQGCEDPRLVNPQADIIMTITSDDFCGHTQSIALEGFLDLDDTECNGDLVGRVRVTNDHNAYINHTTIVRVEAYPALERPEDSPVTVFDQVNSIGALDYSDNEGAFNDEVTFQFHWDGAELRCDVRAEIEVSVAVTYGATRRLSKLLSFRGNADDGFALKQVADGDSAVQRMSLEGSVSISGDGDSGRSGDDSDSARASVSGDMSPMMIGLVVALALLLVAVLAGGAFYVRRLNKKNAEAADVTANTAANVEMSA